MLMRTPSGWFTAAGSVMFVGEVKLVPNRDGGKSPKIDISVSCDKNPDGSRKTVFFAAWDKEVDYIKGLGLAKFDRVHIDGQWSKSKGKDEKEYENYNIETLLVQPFVEPPAPEGGGAAGDDDCGQGGEEAAW